MIALRFFDAFPVSHANSRVTPWKEGVGERGEEHLALPRPLDVVAHAVRGEKTLVGYAHLAGGGVERVGGKGGG